MTRILLGFFLMTAAVSAQSRRIDTANSKLTVYAYKSGLFSFAAHDHEIAAPIASGSITEFGNPGVAFTVRAGEMKVLDPKASDKDRAQIQKDMLSEKVLDAPKYPEITFASTQIRPDGAERWLVIGNLTLHGITKPVTIEVQRENGRYMGTAKIRQKDFGIQPISIAGGTVKVKDEVKIEFSVGVR
jgi:hypothetical protein